MFEKKNFISNFKVCGEMKKKTMTKIYNLKLSLVEVI